MKCREARRALEHEFEGRLDVEEGFALEAHLEDCARCGAIERAQSVLLHAAESAPEPPFANVDVERSLARIHERIATAPERRRRHRPVAFAIALAAAVVIALRLGLGGARVPEREAPAVADRGDAAPVLAEDVAPPRSPRPPAEIDEAPLDRARLAEQRGTVAAALLRASEVLAETGSAAFADEVDRSLAILSREGWPVNRLAGGLLRGSGEYRDPRVRVLALRYLGRRATRATLADLARALESPQLELAAVQALCDAGPEGRSRLVESLWHPRRGEAVLASLTTAPDLDADELSALVTSAFDRRPDRRGDAVASALLEAIVASGPSGPLLVVDLFRRGHIDRTEWLDAFEQSPDAGAILARFLDDAPAELTDADLLAAVARLAPDGADAWVAERLDDPELRPDALLALARLPGERALLYLVESHRALTTPEPELLAALRVALERDAERASRCIRAWTDDALELSGRELAALLVECESPDAVGPLLALVASPRLPHDQRALALDAATELGTAAHEEAFLRALSELEPTERLLRARLLVAIRAACPPETLDRLLAARDPREREEALDLIDRCRNERRRSSATLRLSRRLDDLLAPPTR